MRREEDDMAEVEFPYERHYKEAIGLAVERQDYERAAILILLEVLEAMEAVPEASVDEVIELLAQEAAPQATNGHRRRSERRGRHR